MARIRKGIEVVDDRPCELGYPDYGGGFQPWRNSPILLVNWLNEALSGPPVEREAAGRVGRMIEGLNGFTLRLTKAIREGTPLEGLGFYRLQDIAPYYKFVFDLGFLGRDRKWQLDYYCDYAASFNRHQSGEGSDEEARLELEAAATVVDLALDGRLDKIRRCEVPDCGKWFVAKRDYRALRCKECRLRDRRTATAKRKAQTRAAEKKARKEGGKGSLERTGQKGRPQRPVSSRPKVVGMCGGLRPQHRTQPDSVRRRSVLSEPPIRAWIPVLERRAGTAKGLARAR